MRHSLYWLLALLAVCLLLLTAIPALAQTGGDYDIPWWTVDGGGATFSTGGDYSLGSTIGQPDANVLTGGSFTLLGGFWGGAAVTKPEYHLYLPMVLR